MKVVEQSFYRVDQLGGLDIVKTIELAARNSYKSEGNITIDSYERFVKKLIDSHHDSTLEFGGMIIVHIVTNRAIANEIVRHRMASFNQESTRYVNYTKDKFSNEITFVKPFGLVDDALLAWERAMFVAESSYMYLVKTHAVPPQIARGVLPLDTKTEIVVGANPREWRHIFNQRCDKAAHPQIRELMKDILVEFHQDIPVIFDDLYEKFIEKKG